MHNYKMIYVRSNDGTFLAETLSVMKLCTRHQAVDPPSPPPLLAGIVMTDLQLIAKSLTILIRVHHHGHTQ